MKREVAPAIFYPKRDFFLDYDIPLRVIHIEKSPPYPMHRHDFIELVLIVSGSGIHAIENTKYLLGPGDVFFVGRGVRHGYFETDNLGYINVIFDESLLKQEWRFGFSRTQESAEQFSSIVLQRGHLRLSTFLLREVVSIITKIDQECLTRPQGYSFMCNAYFMQLMGCLLRSDSDDCRKDESTSARVGRVIDVLNHDPSIAISAKEMSDEVGTCSRNLRRIFTQKTGCSPVSYINRVRMKKAEELLLETDSPVSQIALLVGYRDSNYFSRQFHEQHGCSPTEFRSICKE